MGCCDGFFARACAAMPIAMVFMLAALSQIPADEGSRVVMVTRNSHLELKDLVSSFGPRVPTDGVAGTLRLAVPLEACEPLRNNVGGGPWVALVQRGGEDGPTGCSFVTKVLHAQASGAIAVVVFDDRPSGALVPMGRSSSKDDADSVQIPAVFVSRESGLLLESGLSRDSEGKNGVQVTLVTHGATSTNDDDKAGVLSTAFLACVFTFMVVTTARCASRFQAGHVVSVNTQNNLSNAPGERLVTVREIDLKSYTRTHEALGQTLDESLDDSPRSRPVKNGTNDVCTVCLDEYAPGDVIRELECEHAFHKKCVDEWLTTKKSSCPMCKHSLVSGEVEAAATAVVVGVGTQAAEVGAASTVADTLSTSRDSRTPAVSPQRRRRRRRDRRNRARGGDEVGDEVGDGREETVGNDVVDVEAGVRDSDSATVPLLRLGDDAGSGDGGGLFGWVSRRIFAIGFRAGAASSAAAVGDSSSIADSDTPGSNFTEPISTYVAPSVVDVETGGT